jgi:hypothetical protein
LWEPDHPGELPVAQLGIQGSWDIFFIGLQLPGKPELGRPAVFERDSIALVGNGLTQPAGYSARGQWSNVLDLGGHREGSASQQEDYGSKASGSKRDGFHLDIIQRQLTISR